MEQNLAGLKSTLDRASQREHRLRTTVTVLLSRSENQILVLETLLKRLVQVCVHTQDRRLAKELKLIEFTRLAKTLSVDHMRMRQLIGADDVLDPRYLETQGVQQQRGMPPDDAPVQGQSFRSDQGHMASPSGRLTPDMMQQRRNDSSSHDNAPASSLANLWNGDSLPAMQGMQFSNGAGNGSQQSQQAAQQQQQQMMRGQGNISLSRSNGSMAMPSQDRGQMMRDNLGGSAMF